MKRKTIISQTNSPLSHNVSAKQNNTAVLKADRHEIEIFMNSQTRHLQKWTCSWTPRNYSESVRQQHGTKTCTFSPKQQQQQTHDKVHFTFVGRFPGIARTMREQDGLPVRSSWTFSNHVSTTTDHQQSHSSRQTYNMRYVTILHKWQLRCIYSLNYRLLCKKFCNGF